MSRARHAIPIAAFPQRAFPFRGFPFITCSVVALVAAVSHGPAMADAAAGRQKASVCQVCHGYDGIGTNPEVPNIGGESEVYLMRQLEAFRSGERQHQQMSIIASTLSDEDIRDLADYYAAIEITATVPDL